MRLHHLFDKKHDLYERRGSGHGHHESVNREGKARHRRERLFDANDIRLLILYFLEKNTAHGYELIKSIEALAKGEYVPSPGIIYPNLTLLEEMGYIQPTASLSGKKAWQLSDEGKTALATQQSDVDIIIERLESLAVLGDNRRIPELQRAVHNFKMAINTKLGKQDIPQETLNKIIDTLDKAAKEIERC